jgi:hypothetical protein
VVQHTHTAVDFAVNCYERTYRHVLEPGVFQTLLADHARAFARRTAIINNVEDRSDAERRARRLVESGELDAWFFVEDHIEGALQRTGLTATEIARAPYFTDWGLVLVTIPGPDWVVHCDAEVRLREPHDWVTPSIELMCRDGRVMAANPRWYTPSLRYDPLSRSTFEHVGEFALGPGFSDQLFLCRRSELAAPIYRQRCLSIRRYPMAHVCRPFEARIDAWMRHHGRLRATYRDAVYVHPDEIGEGYPARRPMEKLEAVFNAALIGVARRLPVKRRCWAEL